MLPATLSSNSFAAVAAFVWIFALLPRDDSSCSHAFSPPHRLRPSGTRRKRPGLEPLLGIKGFRSWLEAAFPSAVTTTRETTSRDPRGAVEEFDHVLIDANQFLHSNLRKAYDRRARRGDCAGPPDPDPTTSDRRGGEVDEDLIEHTLLLFLQEINRMATTEAVPRKSLVIAVDGSPGAAKLDTQRRRRLATCRKAESQARQIEVLKERGWRDGDFGYHSRRRGGRRDDVVDNPLARKNDREQIALGITPGTRFMDKATQALLYFAWQYARRFPWVRVYVSPSSVHGEGEVKLVDWIAGGSTTTSGGVGRGGGGGRRRLRANANATPNESVAILGGDSDLVVMGLVVPPSRSNIRVIFPGKSNLVVSVQETSAMMVRMIEGTATYRGVQKAGNGKRKALTPSQLIQARLDTALLIIMGGGNDYLPKLRGCKAGIDPFFETYLKLRKSWPEKEGDPFLLTLDGEIICLNVPFSLEFFQRMSPDIELLAEEQQQWSERNALSSQSHLGSLKNLVEAKILPGPISFATINPEDSHFRTELWEMNSKLKNRTMTEEVFAEGVEIVRLTLGHYFPIENATKSEQDDNYETVFTSADGHGVISRMRMRKETAKSGGRAYLFEVPHRQQTSVKATRNRLSCLALEEIFGRENADELFGGGNGNDEAKGSQSLYEQPYSRAQPDAASYLGGLLWNLETYQHGCTDYGYDYGRRAAPTSSQIAGFLSSLEEKGKSIVSIGDLGERTTAAPLADGLACLACLPPQAFHLVPEPYSWLVDGPSKCENYLELHSSCFHEETGAFDIRSFEEKCNAELSKMNKSEQQLGPVNDRKGRRILTGDDFWTVIFHSKHEVSVPFEPPEPFTDRVRPLKRNKRIRAMKLRVKTRVERGREVT